jgi:nucleoside phosphorylase
LKISITFAVEPEFAHWRRLRTFERIAGLPFAAYETDMESAQLRAVLTGMGPEHARRVVASALDWHPDVCISSGLAGSLRSTIHRGAIFAAREVMELESGRTISPDAALLEKAESLGARVADRLLSSPNLVATAGGKIRLGRMAEAVDMESFTVLTEASARRIPAIAIRAISDGSDEGMPLDFNKMLDDRGHVAGSKLALAIARAPHKLPGLIRLGRNSRRAAIALAVFLDSYVQDLARHQVRPAGHAETVRA